MHLMIAVCALVVTGAGFSLVHEYLQSRRVVKRCSGASAFRNILSLIIFLLLTIGPFVLLVWLLWPTR